ncbi:hypothetical protein ACFSYH_01900 [Populibacterium corticicola]|uniref:Uncharacterized protein n=1 Tax=Populibacterium corticicola TaxID=1812826 RepID=A0ABW5XD53_9MICO
MTTSEDPDSLPEETPDESSESPPDIPVGFSFARICEELGYNPETVKALTLTETAVYATGVDYPEPPREATDHGTN